MRRHALAALLVAGVALAGCGGSDDTQAVADVEPAPVATTAAPKPIIPTLKPKAATASPKPRATSVQKVVSSPAPKPRATTAAPKPKPVVTSAKPKPKPAPATDPRYDTCTAAKKDGYGPYHQGQDPEYDWYDDRDDDGIVCE
jgi:outer membrane biosynthesis protein TonB